MGRIVVRLGGAWRGLILAAALASAGCPTADDDDATPADDDAGDDDDDACGEGYVDDNGECVPEHCGVGTWGDLDVGPDTVYVDAAAQDGGDGSEGAPYTTLQDGFDAAGAAGGGFVAVARGTYAENVLLGDDHQNVTLAGRCLELVTLDASAGGPETQAVFVQVAQMGSDPIAVSGLTITGATDVGVAVVGGKLELTDVRVVDNAAVGVGAYNQRAKVWLERVEIVGTTPDADGHYGRGITAQWEATVTATDSWIVDNRQYGVYAADHAVLDFTDVVVANTQPDSAGDYGWGIYALEASELTMQGGDLTANTDAGLYLSGDGTLGQLTAVAIQGTGVDGDGGDGHGVIVAHGAELAATQCEIRDHVTGGLLVQDEGSLATLTDCGIGEIAPDDGGLHGYGVQVVYGATLVATDCEIDECTGLGVLAAMEGSTATLTRVDVLRTADSPSPLTGAMGLGVQSGGQLLATDCRVSDYAIVGAYALGAGSRLELVGTDIDGGAPTDDGDRGGGIGAGDGAELIVTDCAIDQVPVDGILIDGAGTTATLTDVTVSNVQRATTAGVGIGVAVQDHATLDALRLVAEDNEGPGLRGIATATVTCTECTLQRNGFAGVVAQDAAVALVDCTVTDNGTDPNVGGGVGIYAEDLLVGPELSVSGGTVSGHDYAGLWLLGPNGSYDLDGVVIDDHPGVEVPAPLAGRLLFHGDALYATGGIPPWDGAAGLRVAGTTMSGCGGPAVFLDGASALLDGNTYGGNALDLLQQDCAGIDPPVGHEEAGTAELCPPYDDPVQEWTFDPFFNDLPPATQ